MYGEGISKNGEILDLATKDGLVEKAGVVLIQWRKNWSRKRKMQNLSKRESKVALEIEESIRSQNKEQCKSRK